MEQAGEESDAHGSGTASGGSNLPAQPSLASILDVSDAFSTSMLPLAMLSYPLRVSVRALRGVRPEITSVRLEHGEEVVSVAAIETPQRMNVKVGLPCPTLCPHHAHACNSVGKKDTS